MLLRVIFVVFVCVYSSQGWNLDLSGRYTGQARQQPVPGVLNTPRCFGMARRTRQQKINVPLIYNIRTGQSLPFPKFLYSAGPNVIARAEHDGWEVRLKSAYVPRYMYERVPMCCPHEKNCDQGRQIITSPAGEKFGTCANGGQMIYRDGQQRCECAAGFQGIWCQFRALPGDSQQQASFPSGPLIRVLSAPAPYSDMVREAEMWRSKARQFPGSPMLPVRDQPIGAASPWAYGAAAMMQHKMMQAKMAQMEEMYRHSYGDISNQISQQTMGPPNARRNMNILARNPYNVVRSRTDNKFLSASQANKNPYSTISSQGQLPPDMMRAFYVVQEELRRKQAFNPYSHMSQEVPKPLSRGFMQNVNGEHAGVNPYNSRPPQGRDVPQARTPWDLDPFGQQQNPSYMNYPGMQTTPNRNNQAMAMVLYRQLLNQQKGKFSGRNDHMRRPLVNTVGVQTTSVVPKVNLDTRQQQQPQQQQQQQQQQQLLGSPQEESTQQQQVTTEATPSNISEQQMTTNGQPLASMPSMLGPNPQQQPGSEEMKTIEQCQAILTPRLSDCLKDYGLVMEQFMNPEYMQKARAVCQTSESVGQCIMHHDQACGQGEAIMTTRKMINSVLHMMGMICQQIAARGEVPIVPGESQHNFMQAPGSGVPGESQPNFVQATANGLSGESQPNFVQATASGLSGESQSNFVQATASGLSGESQPNFVQAPGSGLSGETQPSFVQAPLEPLAPNEAVPSDRTQPPVEKVQAPHMINENSQQQGEALPKDQSGKSSNLNSVHDGSDVTEVPFSKSHKGHDSAQPVSQDLKVLGYPLWLVITVGLGLFVALILFVVVVCLCCRRRCRQKSVDFSKEIEKVPAPLERVCSIGIPPPSYNTTVLQQNDDGLDLPPLDVSMSVNDDHDDRKVPLEDEADDRSEEKADKETGVKRK